MNQILKVVAMLLFLVLSGYSGTAAASDGPVHAAIKDVTDWTYKVYQEGEKAEHWIAKESPKLWEYVQKGPDDLRHWCEDHKETCAKEITDLGKGITEAAEFVAKELVEYGPVILQSCALILTAAA